jgi:hypothetical protein
MRSFSKNLKNILRFFCLSFGIFRIEYYYDIPIRESSRSDNFARVKSGNIKQVQRGSLA